RQHRWRPYGSRRRRARPARRRATVRARADTGRTGSRGPSETFRASERSEGGLDSLLAGERAIEKVEPVLPPERLATELVPGRAEHAGVDRLLRVLLVQRACRLARSGQRRAVEAALAGDRLQRRRIGDVAFLGP